MKLLAFSDLHRDAEQARRLADLARQVDVVIGAGDFASFHRGLTRTIGPLSRIEAPAVLVPGNNETEAALWRACTDWKSSIVLHGEGTEIDGVRFFGLGGGVPKTPFPWSFDLTEAEARVKLADCQEGGVLIVHSPPKGSVDRAHGRSLGSTTILETIESKQPVLALCGHIHQSWGREDRVGATRIVNLGPAGTLLEI